jgi:hypothetical protein
MTRIKVLAVASEIYPLVKTATGNEVSKDPDDLFYDNKRHRVYAICGEGFVNIVEQADADHYKSREKIATASGARTGLFISERDTLFIAVPHRGKQVAEVRQYQVK